MFTFYSRTNDALILGLGSIPRREGGPLRTRPKLTPIRNYSAREILPDEHQASPKSRFYPVPQNALYVSAGMNVLKFPKGKP